MQVDAYLKLQGIKGECVDKKFLGKGVIQLEWCRVGDAERETPWSKVLRQAKRILEGEDGKDNKGGPKPGGAEKKLAKLEDKVERANLDPLLEKLSEIDEDFGNLKFREVFKALEECDPLIQRTGSSIASDLKPLFKKLKELAEEEKKIEEKKPKTTGQPGATEEKAETKSCAIHVRKMADLATPLLFLKFCQFKTLTDESSASQVIIPTAKLWTRKSGDPLVWKVWEFRTVSVTAFDWTSRDDGTIEENVSFSANTVRSTYRPQESTGKKMVGKSVTVEWDFQKNVNEGVKKIEDSELMS